MNIQHITELFAFDGREFIKETYCNLLRREPDEQGIAYYLGRLAQGHGKAAVIAQLAKSPECRPYDEIKGLKQLITEERRATHWFWRLLGYRQRLEKNWHMGLNELALHNLQCASLQEVLSKQEHNLGQIAQQIAANNQHIANWLDSTVNQYKAPIETPKLSSEIVRQCFVDLLGREPENEDVIEHHARAPSRKALQEVLINSEEFQSKIVALPEYARLILKRQIQQKTNLQGI